MKGGDVKQFTYAGREFDVVAECDIEIALPGYDTESKASGNGRMQTIGKRRLGMLDGIEVVLDNARGDQEFLAEKQASGLTYATTMTLIDNAAWAGSMAIEGELKYKTASGTAGFALRGEKWEQI